MSSNRVKHSVWVPAICFLLVAGTVQAQAWDPVPSINLSAIDPATLSDAEVDRITLNNAYSFQYYLGHFAELANSVVETGPDRGYISLPVWRNPSATFNARVMENHTTLAYYYTTDRPWNPYYNSPAVRDRLEASLEYLVTLQSPGGAFPEYGPSGYNTAATGFGTRFLGDTLRMLESGPAIDLAVLQNAKDADRAAIMNLLNSDSSYNGGKTTSNQYGGMFAGAHAYLDLYPDAEMETLLVQRMTDAAVDFQSPAGYYYESGGADWGYNLRTHEGNTRMVYHYARGTPVGDLVVEGERKFFEWISYNAVPIPGQSDYLLNRAIETRRKFPAMELLDYSLGEEVEVARAFSISVEEQQARIAAIRADNAVNWPAIEPLVSGTSTYSPSAVQYLDDYQWHPTAAQKAAAVAALPYMASDRFVHQRSDGTSSAISTYVRREDYYTAFNSGPVEAGQQRFGLGLLWTPDAGAFIQSQTGSASYAWGTRDNGASKVYEGNALYPEYSIDGTPIVVQAGAMDLPDGVLSAAYNLGGSGTKSVTFADESILVEVVHSDSFTEQIPLLLLDTDDIQITEDLFRLVRGSTAMNIQFDGAVDIQLLQTSTEIAGYSLSGLSVSASGALDYLISFPDDVLNGLFGDVNQDGIISTGTNDPADDDVAAFLAGWNSVLSTDTDRQAWMKGDMNLDRRHDLDDALIMYQALQQAGLPANFFDRLYAVPEPSSVAIAAMLIAGCCMMRVRRKPKLDQ